MKGRKVSTCLYIDRGVLETAKKMGLNLSRVAENALIGAMEKLNGTETGKGPGNGSVDAVRGVRFILSFKTVTL